jgi:glycosyltransferase involved in cell wall biosynthesis
LHPPQPLLINNLNEKPSVKNGLVFTFVGNQFFSKGGKEILNVFKQLAQNGHYIQLNIVSNFSPDQYASNTTAKDIKLLKEQFSQIPDTIKILGPMPNKEVISLLKQSHVALLPTYADTYGYFVLEAQACGCPVVSTNIRALPEINNNECGWVIPVPKDKNGNGILKTSNDRETFSKIIEKNLCTIVNEIIKNPDSIAPKAKASIERIKKQHDPEKHALKLINIYSKTSIKNNNN